MAGQSQSATAEEHHIIARRERDLLTMADDEIKAAAEAAAAAELAAKEAIRADKKRLAACRRQGLGADDCPELPVVEAGSA